MKILHRKQLEQMISVPAILDAIEQGFALYSKGEAVVPPVASLHFESPPGDCHIKYGYAKEGKYYVVKIASGFYHNFKLGIPSGNGLMLLFDKETGQVVALLLDEGYLTDMRTAAAGCIAAKYLAPNNVSCIGVIGTGAQAYYQLKILAFATQCRKVLLWGRDEAKAMKLKEHPDLSEWEIELGKNPADVAVHCNLIVTTTSSLSPILFADQIQPGTHITAIGADDLGKQELEEEIFMKADKVIVDSRSQCIQFGNIFCAIQKGLIRHEKLKELGEIVMDPSLRRTNQDQITVADLTGIAIQDLQIAATLYERSLNPTCAINPSTNWTGTHKCVMLR